MLCDDVAGWCVGVGSCGREAQEERDICMHMADSLHCVNEVNVVLGETNTTSWRNYIPIKIFRVEKRKYT